MRDSKMHTPYGVRDYLPYDCYMKRTLEHAIEQVFHNNGYLSVMSPTFEYIEVYDGKGSISQRQMYKFIDKDGEVLALRSDFTPAIGRMVATNYHKFTEPIRLCYTGSIFRYNKSYQGQLREYTQSGVELIGDSSPLSTLEILLLAINTLKKSALKHFKIALNQVDFIKGVLEETELPEEQRLFVEELIVKKDFISLSDFFEGIPLSVGLKEFLQNMPFFIGGSEILDQAEKLVANKKSVNALCELRSLLEQFDQCGLSEFVELDLNMLGNLDYYTGIIFSGYAKGSAFSIIDGGRYDTLMQQFGVNLPSIGFSININELMLALKNQGNRLIPAISSALLYRSDTPVAEYVTLLQQLMDAEIKIENAFHSSLEEALAYAEKKSIRHLLHLKQGGLTEWIQPLTGNTRVLTRNELEECIRTNAFSEIEKRVAL